MVLSYSGNSFSYIIIFITCKKVILKSNMLSKGNVVCIIDAIFYVSKINVNVSSSIVMLMYLYVNNVLICT